MPPWMTVAPLCLNEDQLPASSVASRHELECIAAVGLLEYLDEDTRPTFITSLHAQSADRTAFLFRNKSLLQSKTLLTAIEREFGGSPSDSDTCEIPGIFRTWINDRHDESGMADKRSSAEAFGLLWTTTTIRQRLKVVSGTPIPEAKLGSFTCEQLPKTRKESDHNALRLTKTSDCGRKYSISTGPVSENSYQSPIDTFESSTSRSGREPLSSNGRRTELQPATESFGHSPLETSLSQHRRWVEEFDWSSTTIGPIDNWLPALRQACDMMLANPDPVAIIWGPERIMIYNESYIQVIKDKHPQIMGGSAWVHFGEFWEEIEPIILEVISTGLAYKRDLLRVLIERSGFMEECFFALTYLPMFDEDRGVTGIYAQVFEVSAKVVVERRMYTLLKISEGTAMVASLADFWRFLVKSLQDNVHDVPFAAVYSVGEEEVTSKVGQSSRSSLVSKLWVLEGAVGFPQNHPAIPAKLDVVHSMDGFAPSFRLAVENGHPTLLHTDGSILQKALLRDLEDRGVEFHCDEIVVCPLFPTTDDEVFGCLLLGINPTRPYDDDYRRFVQLLSRQIENTVASVILFEREKRRLQTTAQQATHKQQMISKQLQVRTREVRESELRYKRFVERAPVGIITVDEKGDLIFCNEAGRDLLGMSGEAKADKPWLQSIVPNDVEQVLAHWKVLSEERRPDTCEYRVMRSWNPPSDASTPITMEHTWIMSNAYPEVSEEGALSIVGVLTDITHQKWAESIQLHRLSEALESKRQQENFMDMTSHEMRNPLHAILQCAEELANILKSFKDGGEQRARDVEDCFEAAQTILYCGGHQKRIIDDILTLSKLDSDLLALAPVEVKPADVVRRVLKIFETELRLSDITTHVSIGPSFDQQCVDTVMMDDSRVIQVMINLMSNASKFTRDRPTRTLDITLSCSPNKPHGDILYVPSGRPRKDLTQQAEWGEGGVVYLYFSVRDTGPGLSEDVMTMLFARFKQASPRTHVQYGGSGLGLFISRELVELHGGKIGLASQVDLGSTFAFYVKARRVKPGPRKRKMSVDGHCGTTKRVSRQHQQESGASGKGPSGQPSEPIASLTDSSKCGVLLVEDNLVNQRVLAKQLRKLGYLVHTANHGEEALTTLKGSSWWRDPPASGSLELSVILMDIEMPVMDGKTCTRRIRELQREGVLYDHIPVIAVTGNARAQQIEDAMDCGFDNVVSKPYRMAELVPRINEFARLNRGEP